MELQLVGNRGTVLIDDADFDLVCNRKWYASCCPWATYATAKVNRCQSVKMHRLLLQAPPGVHVDHVNGNGLDNRRSNIRLATPSQNAANRYYRRGRSRFKGVYPYGKSAVWTAYIGVDHRRMYLGRFATEEEAARAYDEAAKAAFGIYAGLNFPNETSAAL